MSTFDIWDKLADPLSRKAFPDLPQWANSPLLGGRPSLFRLIGEITALRLGDQTREHISLLKRRLFDEDHLTRTGVLTAWNENSKSTCYAELRLFSTAAKILLLKSINPDRLAAEPSIQELVCEGMDQLTSWSSTNRFDQYFCWPILIIGCAVTQHEHIGIIRRKLTDMWRCSHCGDVWRVRTVLEHAWDMRQRALAEELLDDAEPGRVAVYGNDILLNKEGVFNLLSM